MQGNLEKDKLGVLHFKMSKSILKLENKNSMVLEQR